MAANSNSDKTEIVKSQRLTKWRIKTRMHFCWAWGERPTGRKEERQARHQCKRAGKVKAH